MVSSHRLLLELFLKVIFLLGFEAGQPSEELPRILLLDLEALLLVHACSPEFSTPQQLLWPLAHELMSRRSLAFASCFDEKAQCLFQHSGGLLGSRGRPRSHCSEASCGVFQASLFPGRDLPAIGSRQDVITLPLRENGLHGGLSVTRCELFAACSSTLRPAAGRGGGGGCTPRRLSRNGLPVLPSALLLVSLAAPLCCASARGVLSMTFWSSTSTFAAY